MESGVTSSEFVTRHSYPRALNNVNDRSRSSRNVLFVTSECADLVKVGGLGDVSSALPQSLSHRHDVRLLIPGYRQIVNKGHRLRIVASLPAFAELPAAKLGRLQLPSGVIVYVVLCPELYERKGNPYMDQYGQDWPDNPLRFARLCLAAAALAGDEIGLGWAPDLLHGNDWPCGLISAYLRRFSRRPPCLFTIHNLSHQGLCEPHYLTRLGLNHSVNTLSALSFHGQLSFLKAGICHADQLSTVSKTYARDITTEGFGCGLHTLLAKRYRQGRLIGIQNGIDYQWHPQRDPHLLCREATLSQASKALHRRHIFARHQLQPSQGPLFAIVSRLVPQKGIDLTLAAIDDLLTRDGRIVAMGSGQPELETALQKMASRHPGLIAVDIGFNECEAHRLFAASDFLLMPSRFEPCGLSQLYAQRFASLPIAMRTGGLADSVADGINGFLFDQPTLASYQHAIDRAQNVYQRPELLNAMRNNAMRSPLYWDAAIEDYDRIYQRLIKERPKLTAGTTQ